MTVIDIGSGVPVVLVPGIQGRWEWMRPAVDALSKHGRAITFSLADEPTSGWPRNPTSGFDTYIRQIEGALDAAGVPSAVICGVSYGGLIAAAFAARRAERTRGLVLASAIPPSWTPDARVRFLMRAPRLLSPIFCVSSLRLFGEMVAARRGVAPALAFAARHVGAIVRHPFSPRLMAQRVRMLEGPNLQRELAGLQIPTLVVTGDAALDRVVPVSMTREYLRLWPHATAATIPGSGHLGCITKADEFAALVIRFAETLPTEAQQRRRSVV